MLYVNIFVRGFNGLIHCFTAFYSWRIWYTSNLMHHWLPKLALLTIQVHVRDLC
jgi:hypothetical protein